MNVGTKRLDTFFDHQPVWPYINNTLYNTPEEFASAGFYNVSTKRMVDKVQCYICNVTLMDWKQGQCPLERHALTSAQCPLVILNFPGSSLTRGVLDNDSDELLLKARLTTFTKNTAWPPLNINENIKRTTRSSSRQRTLLSAEKLAQAGYIFAPTLECLDRVQCPECQYYLDDLQTTLDPWLLHQQSNPNCLFVTRCRSNTQLKNGPALMKRGKDNTRLSFSLSTPLLEKRQRSATTVTIKTTTSNDSSAGNNCHDGGVDTDETNDSIKRSIDDDSIWDIGSLPSTSSLTAKRHRVSPSIKLPHLTYSRKLRKASSRKTRSPATPVNQSIETSSPASTPIETAAQLLMRLQKLPITRITSNDKGKGRAIENLSPKTTKKLGRDSLRLSTKKKQPSIGIPPSSTSHTVEYTNESKHMDQHTKMTFLSAQSSSSFGNNINNAMSQATMSCGTPFNRLQGSSSL